MATLRLSKLAKAFADGTTVVRDVDISLTDGEFCVLLGPSGCGKSTTLRIVAGLERASAGAVLIDGVDVTNAEPKDRDVAMVFQNYALYPHLTVAENIAFPLSMRGVDKATRASLVRDVAQMLELQDLLDRRPAQLSGGQRQRVAMARALVRKPKVFLFDEPLSNLDARLRAQTRRELKSLHSRVRITSVYVTHDQEEAMSLADKVAVMAEGTIQQYGTPLELFRTPANRFVAGFVGTPAMNFIEARVDAVVSGSGPGLSLVLHAGDNRWTIRSFDGRGVRVGDVVVLGVRPGGLRVVKSDALGGQACAMQVRGVVESCDLLGEVSDVWVRCGEQVLLARLRTQEWLCEGCECVVSVPEREVYVFEPGAMGRRVWGGADVEADTLVSLGG